MKTILFLSLAAASLSWAPALAQSVTGRVVSPALLPIPGITVDAGSGSTQAVTDALGVFTITSLQNGHSYDVEFVPPFGAPWAATIVTATVVGAVQLGDVALQPGFPVSGIARTAAGVGVLGANINVYAQNGAKLFTPRDGTDALGNFQVFVPAGTWDVRVVPPTGALLVPRQFENVGVTAATNLGVALLPTAYTVSGSVVDLVTAVPVGNTRLRAYDALTGQRIYSPVETANTFGQFTLLLPFGIVDLEVEPPVGNTHVARQVYGALVLGNTALGQLRLQNGALLSGSVTAGGLPVAGTDVDVLYADGSKVYTPRDATAANGAFTVAVPTGTPLRVRAEPRPGTAFAGTVTAPTTLTAAANVGAIALPAGFAVSGTITGATGPEAGASLHFFDLASNVEQIVGAATTGSTGQFTTYVPAGNWRVEVRTAEASLSRPAQPTLAVAAATSLNVTLSAKLARCGLTSFGTPTLPQNSQLPINVFLHSMVPGLQTVLIDLAVRLPNGTELPILPGLPLGLPPIPFTVDFVWVPVPTIPANYVGRVVDMVVRLRATDGITVLDEATTPFVVQ